MLQLYMLQMISFGAIGWPVSLNKNLFSAQISGIPVRTTAGSMETNTFKVLIRSENFTSEQHRPS